jgi:hypothetical protein
MGHGFIDAIDQLERTIESDIPLTNFHAGFRGVGGLRFRVPSPQPSSA